MSVLNDTQKMELERRLEVMKTARTEMMAATDKLDRLAASKRLLVASNSVNLYLEELTTPQAPRTPFTIEDLRRCKEMLDRQDIPGYTDERRVREQMAIWSNPVWDEGRARGLNYDEGEE